MNRAELITAMAETNGITKKAAGQQLDVIMNVISETLAKGDDIKIHGFGTFSVAERSAREGRNPQTGEIIAIKAAKIPKFKPSRTLKNLLNE